MNDIPLSLYVHFPWCVRKCPYCDFNSHEAQNFPEGQYLEALVADLRTAASRESRRSLHSVFIGGGTPSLFSPRAISKLLDEVRSHFAITDVEITIEANPGTFDQSHFDGYREAGVNRISIGAQSFDSASLEALGRVHNPADILKAYEGARRAGFERINLDLMHGLPGQSPGMARGDLETAISLGPEHISWYQLTIEPNTVFYSRRPPLPADEVLDAIIDDGMHRLADAGFVQYEVSAFALPGEQSVHNLNYWLFGDYLGIGAGAHGKLTEGERLVRTTRTRVPNDYIANPGSRTRQVPAGEIRLEFLLNALRLTGGFTLELFTARTGLPVTALDDFLEKGIAAGLLEPDTSQQVIPTARGRWYLNDLLLLA